MANTHAIRPQDLFPAPVSGEERKWRIYERISGSCRFAIFLSPIIFLYRSATYTEPVQHLLIVEKTVENSNPLHSYAARIFQEPEVFFQCITGRKGVHLALRYRLSCYRARVVQ